MKRLIIAIALFIPFLINAQSKAENEVAAAVEQLRKAMVDGDRAVLEKLTSDKQYDHTVSRSEINLLYPTEYSDY